jgi:hypothetical protein
MRRKSLVIGATVIGLLAGYVYATPYITLFMLQRAMETKNAKDVEKFIDFPGVRDSLRSQYSEYIKEYVKGDQQDMHLAAFSAGVGNALIGTFIDQAIKPSNLQKWLDGDSIIAEKSTDLDVSIRSLNSASSTMSMGYQDPETFEVRFKDSGSFQSITLERRNVVFWKIVGIRLDLSLLNQVSGRGANEDKLIAPDEKFELKSDVSYVDYGPGSTYYVIKDGKLYAMNNDGSWISIGKPTNVSANIAKIKEDYLCKWTGFAEVQIQASPDLGSGAPWRCTRDGIRPLEAPRS